MSARGKQTPVCDGGTGCGLTQHVRRVVGPVFLPFMIGCALAIASPGEAQTCLAADSLVSARLTLFKRVFTSPDTQSSHSRQLLKVPATSANKISLTTNKSICAAAMRALDSMSVASGHSKPASRSAYVYRIGSYFATEDPGTPDQTVENGQRKIMFFSPNWAYLSGTLLNPPMGP